MTKPRVEGKQSMTTFLSRLGAASLIGMSSVGMMLPPPAAAQSVATWKTVSDPKTGVFVSMPPGVIVKPSARLDAKTGAKMASFEANQQTAASSYIVAAIRMNTIAVDQLRKTFPPAKEPLDVLYEAKIQPQINRLLQMAKSGTGGNSLQRKPITMNGLQGEDISGIIQGKQGKGGIMHMRLLKNKNSVYVQFAGERMKGAEGDQHMAQFFKSFKVASTNPLK